MSLLHRVQITAFQNVMLISGYKFSDLGTAFLVPSLLALYRQCLTMLMQSKAHGMTTGYLHNAILSLSWILGGGHCPLGILFPRSISPNNSFIFYESTVFREMMRQPE